MTRSGESAVRDPRRPVGAVKSLPPSVRVMPPNAYDRVQHDRHEETS